MKIDDCVSSVVVLALDIRQLRSQSEVKRLNKNNKFSAKEEHQAKQKKLLDVYGKAEYIEK